ncbi:MAG TPA: metal ABC transporter permease [Actinomycetota bacterium]|nr:metal ABC transporter permease [Actinomycetota bacterium]
MPWPIDLLPYPFELPFMQRTLVAAVAVGVFAPTIGTYLVQKRLALIGDGIGHVAFAGVGVGVLAGLAPVATALVLSVAGAVGIEELRSRKKASGDLALALFFYSGIALGVVLISHGGGLNRAVSYLFGQPLTATSSEVLVILGIAVVIVGAALVLRRLLLSVVTDEDWSSVAGLPVRFANNLLAVLTACAVVAAMQIVGILLVAAMMVLPVASAQALGRSFAGVIRWAVAIGVFAAVVGLAAARVWDLAPGGTIVLVAAAVFAVVGVVRRGVTARLLQREARL